MGRLPKTKFPNGIARDYYSELRKRTESMRKLMWDWFDNEGRELVKQYRQFVGDRLYTKADDPLDDIRKQLERLRDNAEKNIFKEYELHKISKKFVQDIAEWNRENWKDQVRSIVDIDPTLGEEWLESFMSSAIQENVSYIKSIPEQHFNNIESIMMQGVREGKTLKKMASEISDRAKSSKKRAKFIARDQSGSIHGDLRRRRCKELGLKKFIWVTAEDERVRGKPGGYYPHAIPNHWDLHNEELTWNKGAERYGGLLPGKDYNCRCTDEPVYEELAKLKN